MRARLFLVIRTRRSAGDFSLRFALLLLRMGLKGSGMFDFWFLRQVWLGLVGRRAVLISLLT